MKLILMAGIAGSGKSTKANQIAADAELAGKKYIILSTDDIISGRNGHGYLFSPDYAHKAHELNRMKCERAMELGYELIIIDNTNLTMRDRKIYLDLAAEYGYDNEVVKPDTEWANNPAECHKRTLHNVPLETIIKMKEKMEL